MTMQQALETAYNDWNKQKANAPNVADSELLIQEEKSSINSQTMTSFETTENNNSDSDSDPKSSLISKETTEIPFYYGNPTVDLVKGFIHIYKDW